RIDQTISLDFQWHLSAETVAFFGGSLEQVNYTGDEPISFNAAGYYFGSQFGPPIYYSDSRDNRSYFGYVGIQHNFLPNLNVSAKAGVQYTDDYNDPLNSPSAAPYAVVSVIYTYSPGSYAEIGFTQQRNATDVVSVNANTNSVTAGRLTQDQESSDVYASINHQITPKLLG